MLKLFYICYFVVIGVSTPFFAAYLRRLGLSGQTVSTILAVAPTLQLGVPLLWGWLADRSRRPILVLRVLCLGACLASVLVVFARSMPLLLFLYVAQQFFAGSITALADAIAVEQARSKQRDYTGIRIWGSLSFVATCLTTGAMLDWRALKDGDPMVPALVTGGFALSFLASLGLKGSATWEAPRLSEVRELLRDGRLRFLLVVAGLHWLGLSPFHGFFGVLLQDRGLPATTTSQAFMAGSCAEIVLFTVYARLRSRFRLESLFAASFIVTAFHWWIVAYTRSALLIVSTQLLHAMTFGMFWATSMAWIGECVPSKLRATGQMLFSTTLGLGAMVGFPAVGALYDATHGAGSSFCVAGALEVAPIVLVLARLLVARRKSKPVR
jgi:MFS transporter, PPP family, 3-phenylpropionic acid transporter